MNILLICLVIVFFILGIIGFFAGLSCEEKSIIIYKIDKFFFRRKYIGEYYNCLIKEKNGKEYFFYCTKHIFQLKDIYSYTESFAYIFYNYDYYPKYIKDKFKDCKVKPINSYFSYADEDGKEVSLFKQYSLFGYYLTEHYKKKIEEDKEGRRAMKEDMKKEYQEIKDSIKCM